MADFSLQYVTRVCPELCQAEAQAVRDHVLDTWPADAVYPDVVKQAARSLFPYSASPAMPSGSDLTHSDKLERARKALVDAHTWLSRTALSDQMAMTQRDLSFLISSIEVELSVWARQERKQEWLKKQERSGKQAMVWRDGDIFSGKTHRFDTNQAAYDWLAAQPDPENYHIRWGDCSPTDTKYEPDLKQEEEWVRELRSAYEPGVSPRNMPIGGEE